MKLTFRKGVKVIVAANPLELKKVVLVGNPNVGKSVIFRLLTGSYVLVSNFPGTTVEVSRSKMQLGGISYEVVDTPGVNSLIPQSEDERVTCEILLREKPDVIVQVADAKNNAPHTADHFPSSWNSISPMVLVLNMIDEAEERGSKSILRAYPVFFSIPVVETIAIYSKGRKQLQSAIQTALKPKNPLPEHFAGERINSISSRPASPFASFPLNGWPKATASSINQ